MVCLRARLKYRSHSYKGTKQPDWTITTHNRKRDHFHSHRGPLQHMHMLLSNSIGPCPIGDGPLSDGLYTASATHDAQSSD